MLLYEPPPSPADIHFRVLGIPVRVHPLFWLTTLFLGVRIRGGTPPVEFVTWVMAVFVSVLIHELGHALMQRRYGGHPWITLQMLGGLASCNDCDRGPLSQILIGLAGPAAGFLFALVIVAALRLAGLGAGLQVGEFNIAANSPIVLPMPVLTAYWEPLRSEAANYLIWHLLYVNIMWGLVNLLPVYPLDGGQVARELFMLRSPQRGVAASLWLSMITAAGMAAYAMVAWGHLFTAAMFGYMAYANHQTLQGYRRY